MATGNRPSLVGEPGIRFGIANAAIVLAVATCATLGIEAPWAVLLLAVVVLVTASGTSITVGGAVGLVAWAIYVDDLARLCLLVGVGAVAASVRERRSTPRSVNSGGLSWQTWPSSP